MMSSQLKRLYNNALPGIFLVLLSQLALGKDVPMQKAIPPKMDPIPVLPKITNRVFLKIEIDDEPVGKIVIGLFGELAPKTTENFRKLATCELKEPSAVTGKPLCYRGSTFHRSIPNFMIQGGDFTHHDGTGGESIYGGRFEDETFDQKHNRPFMVGMSNSGRDSNGSQFYITTVKTQWLDNKNVIFGMLLEGKDVVKQIEKQGTYGGKPRSSIKIIDCGEDPLKDEDKEVHY